MYDITNRKEIIREIKKYLYEISTHTYPEIQRGTIDGIYDEETKDSVKRFQKIKKLAPTGIVDYLTFMALADEYKEISYESLLPDSLIEYQSFPMIYGDMSEDVRLLNMMINELGNTYSDIVDVGNDSLYSKRTVKAIERLEEIFGYKITGVTDARLYARIKEELNSQKRIRRTDDLKNSHWQ